MFGFGNKWKHLPQLPCPRSHEGLPYHLMSDAFKKEVDATHWRDDGTCSYCGSINPEQLFKAIDDGVEIGPTDKEYKIYLHGQLAPQVRGACKFYFQHLIGSDMERFVELYNNKTMKIGYPGRFYVIPFFMKRIEKDG